MLSSPRATGACSAGHALIASAHVAGGRRARISFTSMGSVKDRRRGTSRVSSKHQVTIPTDALRAAGLQVGERLVAHADGPGRVVFEREVDVLAEVAGALTRSEEHTSELQSLMRISYAGFCL